MGKLDEARESYVQALSLDPWLANAYLNYADSVKFTTNNPYLKAMEAMREGKTPLSESGRLQLDFALAKAYADLKEYARSFRCLLNANALKRSQIRYNQTATLALFDRIESTFTASLLREKEKLSHGHSSRVPIFILGMPRSGSTLVEQILAGHPDIHAAGELNTINKIVDEVHGPDPIPVLIPNLYQILTPAR